MFKDKILIILFFLISFKVFSEFNWYKTQRDTGIGNCGPACVAMSLKWYTGSDFEVEFIRSLLGYRNYDGSTSIEELNRIINIYAKSFIIKNKDLSSLTFKDTIYIVNINTVFISENPLPKFGRDYKYFGGHYIILHKKQQDYFVVNDPYTKLGANYFYKISDVEKALRRNKIIQITKDQIW